jgi:hypothetical protein
MAKPIDPAWVSVTQWTPIAGRWTTADLRQRYEGPGATPPPGAHGLALCSARFQDGLVRVTLLFNGSDGPLSGESAGILLGYHAESGAYVVAGLGGFEVAFAIWEFVPGLGWAARRATGSIQNLRYNCPYKLQVSQKGQRISLVVDDVVVLDHVLPSPLPGNQLGLYAMSKSPVTFDNFQVERRAPTAFVAMQFGKPYDDIYRTVIRPKARAMGFEVIRIDEVNRPGIILQDIQRKIEDAKVVIAEITAANQNVYYEIGYAHALNKPTILLAQSRKALPFDIRSYRVIFYDDSIGGKSQVEKKLREYLKAILQEI